MTVRQLVREIAYVCAFVVVIGLLIVLIYTLRCGYAAERARTAPDRSAPADRCIGIDRRCDVTTRVLAIRTVLRSVPQCGVIRTAW
ncbi:UNVERIFIED_ORG: hypothetical protein BDU10_7458 [Burkholderia sp. CF145]